MSFVGVAIAVTAVAGVTAAYGSYAQGQASKKMNKYNADVAAKQATLTARTAEQNIQATQTQASLESKQLRQNVAKLEGTQKAVLAASGIGGGSVTTADIQSSTIDTAQLDQMALRYNADYKSWAIRNQTDIDVWGLENQSNQYLMAGKNAATAGNIGAASSLLQSASQAATLYASTSGKSDKSNTSKSTSSNK